MTVKYNGQQQTCGRCHRTSKNCRGGGIAKKCQAEGGIKVDFTDYILNLWREIGYNPKQGQLNHDMNVDDEEVEAEKAEAEEIETVKEFTPVKIPAVESEKFSGVRISRFPKGLDDGEIIAMICRCGLAENKKDNIVIKAGGFVTVKNITTEESNALIDAIHGQRFFERKLFCNGIVPLTPDKQGPPSPAAYISTATGLTSRGVPTSTSKARPLTSDEQGPPAPAVCVSVATSASSTGSVPTMSTVARPSSPGNTPESTAAVTVDSSSPFPAAAAGGSDENAAAPLLTTSSSTSVAAHGPPASGTPGRPSLSRSVTATGSPLTSWRSADPNVFSDFKDNYNLVRRHSISLINRTPPHQSIAAEILGSCKSTTRDKARLLVNEITDCLSEFNSCVSDFSSDKSSDENDDKVNEGEKNNSMNEKKRTKRNKRKNSLTPNKDFFMKKQNTELDTSS